MNRNVKGPNLVFKDKNWEQLHCRQRTVGARECPRGRIDSLTATALQPQAASSSWPILPRITDDAPPFLALPALGFEKATLSIGASMWPLRVLSECTPNAVFSRDTSGATQVTLIPFLPISLSAGWVSPTTPCSNVKYAALPEVP